MGLTFLTRNGDSRICFQVRGGSSSQVQIQTESQTDTDVDDDSMLEMEGSLGEQAFVQAGMKQTKSGGVSDEKSWERLFKVIYYHMRELLKK
jgi:hypothetical protein